MLPRTFSKKRQLVYKWRERADERAAMADALDGPSDPELDTEVRRQHVQCLRVMADTFKLCADELDKA